MHVPRYIARQMFGEIRALTTDEIGRMQSELARIGNVISQKQSDLSAVMWNPLNYVLGTQRDAIARLKNGIAQDQLVLDQLAASRNDVIESGDTDRLQEWFNLAAVVGDAADLRVWQSQMQFSQTTQTVKNVAEETAKGVKNPFGVPWYVWAGGLGVLWLALGRRR